MMKDMDAIFANYSEQEKEFGEKAVEKSAKHTRLIEESLKKVPAFDYTQRKKNNKDQDD